MKSRFLLWLFYGALGFVGVASGTLLAIPTKPQIVALKTIHNFGIVQPGGDVQHYFEIKNEGRQPLKITKINVSCGCIKDAHTEADTIAPGNSTKLLLTWEPPTYEKDVLETVDIETNDPDRPIIRFTIQAQVKPEFNVEPAVLNFGVLESSDLPTNETIVVEKNVGGVSATDSVKVSSNNEALKATSEKKEDGTWDVKIALDKNAPLGPLDGYLTITPSWSGPRKVPLLGEIVGSVAADPGEVYLESAETKTGTESIQVSANEGEAPVTETKFLSLTPALAKYFKVVVARNQIAVSYDLSSPAAPRAIKGRLLVEAKQGNSMKQISIPITVAR